MGDAGIWPDSCDSAGIFSGFDAKLVFARRKTKVISVKFFIFFGRPAGCVRGAAGGRSPLRVAGRGTGFLVAPAPRLRRGAGAY